MPSERDFLPEGPLSLLLRPDVPRRLRRVGLRVAARELAGFCLAGGDPGDLDLSRCRVEDGRLRLFPTPARPRSGFPDRARMEAGFGRLTGDPELASLTEHERLTLLAGLVRHGAVRFPELRDWSRVFVAESAARMRSAVRFRYHTQLAATRTQAEAGVRGEWRGSHPQTPDALLHAVEACRALPDRVLKRGERATVWAASLLGEEVILKRYEPNPRGWRRLVETSRARRAWTGAQVLRDLGIRGLEPLGWIEFTHGPDRGAGYFISRVLPGSETVRAWMRREWPRLTPAERTWFRHRLRHVFRELYRNGLVHLDSKLSNLLVCGREVGDLEFVWTDLEDIRPRRFPQRAFIRNLYQLNGSLPRCIPREERLRFLRGFADRFPFAASPRLARYIERETLRRHRRELRRICGA